MCLLWKKNYLKKKELIELTLIKPFMNYFIKIEKLSMIYHIIKDVLYGIFYSYYLYLKYFVEKFMV